MLGTALASVFVTYGSWRWAFASAAPVGGVALLLALRMAPDRLPARRGRVDWAGAALLVGMLTALSLSLSHFHEGAETFEAGWPYHGAMHLLTAILLALLVWVERRLQWGGTTLTGSRPPGGQGFGKMGTSGPEPLVQFDQLRNGVFVSAVGANCILHMTMLMVVFSTPFLIERGLGLSAARTGTLLAVVQLSNTGMTLLGGWLYDRTGSPMLRPLALGAVASGLLLLGVSGAAGSYATFFAVSLLMGCGSGLFMTANNTVIMGALPRAYAGFATGMLETTRQLGHTLGVMVATAGLGVTVAELTPAAQQAAFVAGFQRACLLMGTLALVGVALAAMTRTARREGVRPAPVLADIVPQ
jgi:MFS family permease